MRIDKLPPGLVVVVAAEVVVVVRNKKFPEVKVLLDRANSSRELRPGEWLMSSLWSSGLCVVLCCVV